MPTSRAGSGARGRDTLNLSLPDHRSGTRGFSTCSQRPLGRTPTCAKALELAPALTPLLSRTPRCSQRPRSSFHPRFLPFFLSLFSIFLPTPTPLGVWTLIALSSCLIPGLQPSSPTAPLGSLGATCLSCSLLCAAFPVSCAPQASQSDGKESAHRPSQGPQISADLAYFLP